MLESTTLLWVALSHALMVDGGGGVNKGVKSTDPHNHTRLARLAHTMCWSVPECAGVVPECAGVCAGVCQSVPERRACQSHGESPCPSVCQKVPELLRRMPAADLDHNFASFWDLRHHGRSTHNLQLYAL